MVGGARQPSATKEVTMVTLQAATTIRHHHTEKNSVKYLPTRTYQNPNKTIGREGLAKTKLAS